MGPSDGGFGFGRFRLLAGSRDKGRGVGVVGDREGRLGENERSEGQERGGSGGPERGEERGRDRGYIQGCFRASCVMLTIRVDMHMED